MMASMNIHAIETVKIATRKFDKTANHDAYRATDYLFIDKKGERFVITAFSDHAIKVEFDP